MASRDVANASVELTVDSGVATIKIGRHSRHVPTGQIAALLNALGYKVEIVDKKEDPEEVDYT